MKKFIALLLVLMMAVPAFAMTAGTYEAEAQGMMGKIAVSVVVNETAIESVTVTAQNETPAIAAPAIEQIPAAIVANQSLVVDVVAGATYTSKAIINASPMHNTMVFTNLASIRTNHIHHHIYDFGTTSLLMAAGNPREVPRRTRDGEIEHVKCLPIGLVMDERIASGYYFSQAFRRMKEYFKNPALLEEPPERVLVDPEL